MKEPVFEVFARKSRGEPLRHVGFVNAETGDLTRVYAWKTYDEQNWFEMCVIPRDAILAVNRTERWRTAQPAEPQEKIVHMAGAGSYGGSEVANGTVVE